MGCTLALIWKALKELRPDDIELLRADKFKEPHKRTDAQDQMTAAALAAFDLVAAKAGEVDPARIVALGRSVGGGPASDLGARGERSVQATTSTPLSAEQQELLALLVFSKHTYTASISSYYTFFLIERFDLVQLPVLPLIDAGSRDRVLEWIEEANELRVLTYGKSAAAIARS